jgi:hypothetical protein
VCWLDVARLKSDDKDCLEGFKQALGPAYCMPVASLALASLQHWLQSIIISSSAGSSSATSGSRNISRGNSRRSSSRRQRGVQQVASSTAAAPSRPPTALQQELLWAALKTASGIAALSTYNSLPRVDTSVGDTADAQLLQSLTDGDTLLLFAASLSTYTGLLHRKLGKSPMATAGASNSSSSSSSSPAAASRRRQQQLKCVPEHHVELLNIIGMPALVKAPSGDEYCDDVKPGESLAEAFERFLHPLMRSCMNLAQQHAAARSFPSSEQQLLYQSIVAVVGELAVLAPSQR